MNDEQFIKAISRVQRSWRVWLQNGTILYNVKEIQYGGNLKKGKCLIDGQRYDIGVILKIGKG